MNIPNIKQDKTFKIVLIENEEDDIIINNYKENIYNHILNRTGLLKYLIKNKTNIIFLYKLISLRVKNIPILFGASLETKDFKKFSYNIYLGNHIDYIKEECLDKISKELIKGFIIKEENQIIDYIQDKEFEIGKLF